MGKMLIIPEKESVAVKIAKALGGFTKGNGCYESGNAVIAWGQGHLVQIEAPQFKTQGRDLASLPVIPDRFEMVPVKGKGSLLRVVLNALKRPDIDVVINACDAAREGERIFQLIYGMSNSRKPVERMWLKSMTPAGIREAFDNRKPGDAYRGLAMAAQCRDEGDLIFGLNGTRATSRLRERQTGKFEVMNFGRVVIPTTGLIVYLEEAIRKFVPQPYWELQALFQAAAGQYGAKWYPSDAPVEDVGNADEEQGDAGAKCRILDQSKAAALLEKCRNATPERVDEDSKATSRPAPRLFSLNDLQQEANRRYKFSAKQTLKIAQSLYDKEFTTYPRTDSDALPEADVEATTELVRHLLGTSYAPHAQRIMDAGGAKPDKRVFDDSRVSDHSAIVPTGLVPAGLDDDESKIFDLVMKRFLAALHPAAEYLMTRRTTFVAGEQFRCTGRVLTKAGWLDVYGQGENLKDGLCKVLPGEKVSLVKIESCALQTTPPKRYTEATLLKAMKGAERMVDAEHRAAMKGHALGTPATQADIIERILSDRDGKNMRKEPYVRYEGKEKYLVPTEKAMDMVLTQLDANGLGIATSPRLTGEWEHNLLEVEKGRMSREEFMSQVVALTLRVVATVQKTAASLPAPAEKLLGVPCPSCSAELLAGPRKIECKGACGFSIWREIAGRELTDPEARQLLADGEIPPLSGFKKRGGGRAFSAGLRLLGDGKIDFVFPERAAQGELAKLGVSCPKCSSGIEVRTGDHPSYACSACDFKLWKIIAGRALSDAEASRLITEGELPAVSGFRSRPPKKSTFSAGLKLSADKSRAEFVFEPR